MAESTSKAQIELTAVDNASAVLKGLQSNVEQVGGSFDKFKGLIAGAAAAVGLFKIADGFQSWVAGAAALDNFAERTGASVEGLSGMRSLLKVVGGDMEGQMVPALEKLARSMSETLGSSTTNSARAFAQLGISVSDAQGNLRATDDVMLEFAQKLNSFESGAGKTAIAMAVLGKSGAQMLPILKHMGELTEFQTKLTAEQADQAEKLEITWKKLGMTFEGGAKVLYAAAMPAVAAFSEALLDVAVSAKKGQGGIESLARDGTLAEWAKSAAIGVAYVIDVFQGLWGIIKTGGQAIGALLAHGMNIASTLGDAFVAVVKADYAALPDIIRRGTAAMNSINTEFAADFRDNIFPESLFSDKVKARLEGVGQDAGKAVRKGLNFSLKEDKGGAGDDLRIALQKAIGDFNLESVKIGFKIEESNIDAGIKALERFQAAAGATESGIAQIADLSMQKIAIARQGIESERDAIAATLNALWASYAKAPDEKSATRALTAMYGEYKKLLPLVERSNALDIESENIALKAAEARIKLAEAIGKQLSAELDIVRATEKENDAIRLSNEQLGLTERQINALNIARAEQKIRTYEAAAAVGEMTDQDRAGAEAMQLYIDRLKKRDDLLLNKERLQDMQNVLQGVRDTAVSFFEDLFQNGSRAFGNLWTKAKSFFAQLAAQFAVRYVLGIDIGTGGGGGAAGSLLNTLMGGGGTTGGGGGIGSLLSGLFGGGGGGGLGALGGSFSGAFQNVLGSLFGSGGSILSVLGQLAGALGPLGAAAGVIAMIAQHFDGSNGTGIKFGRDAYGTYGDNPGAAANIFTNRLGNFAYEGDDANANALKNISPFVQRFNALANLVGGQLADSLGDSALKAVQDKIGKLRKENWFQYDGDPAQALQKATADLMKDVFGTAYEAINPKLADIVKGFNGTGDELLSFLEKVVSIEAAIKQANDAQSIDSLVTDALSQQSNSVLYAYQQQVKGLDSLLAVSPDATDALGQLVTGFAAFRSAAVQMEMQIRQVKAAMDGMFGDAIRQIELGMLDTQGQYNYLQTEADRLAAEARVSNDPLQIQTLLQRILGDVSQAQGLLTPDQRAALGGDQITRLNALRAELQARMDALSAANSTTVDNAQQALIAKMQQLMDAQLASAKKQTDAADKQITAANTPLTVNVNLMGAGGRVQQSPVLRPAEVGG